MAQDKAKAGVRMVAAHGSFRLKCTVAPDGEVSNFSDMPRSGVYILENDALGREFEVERGQATGPARRPSGLPPLPSTNPPPGK